MALSLNRLPNLHRAVLVVQTAPVSVRRRFLLLIYTFLSYLFIHILPIQSIFLTWNLYFVAPIISFRA